LNNDQSGVLTTYAYTNEGDIETVTDANANVTTFSNYHRGSPQTVSRPEGVTEFQVVNDDGTLYSSTNGRGYTTLFSWDDLNRLTGINFPVNADVSISYDNDSAVLTRGAYKETQSFDGFWRSLGIKREDTSTTASIEVTKERDEVGNVTFESYPNSTQGKNMAYDALRRTTSITFPDQTSRTFSYPNGAVVLEVDENGQQTEKLFVSHGSMDDAWLTSIYSPESIGTLIYRDGLGQVYRVFQGEVQQDGQLFGYARLYTRDTRGFLMQETHQETGTTVYGRDNAGNMTSKEIGLSGIVETRTYDGLNRVEAISYSDGTPTATFSYDDNSYVTSVSNSTSTRTYNYDLNGNLKAESLTIGSATYDVSYGIDNLDYLSSMTYPSGRVVDYGTNAFGWQTQAAPYVSSVTHYPSGSLDTMSYANGVVTDQNLDSRLRPDSLVAGNGQLNFVDLQFGYDLAGNLDSVVDNVGSLHDRTIGYDGANRLTSATGPWGTETISYDGRGNILTRDRNGDLQEYYYSSDKMTYRVFPNFYYIIAHDARGNMTSDGLNIMVYDGAGNLRTTDNGTLFVDYDYDGANTRVKRETPSETTNIVYNASGDLLGEYEPQGGFKEYIYVDSQVAAKVTDSTTVVGQ